MANRPAFPVKLIGIALLIVGMRLAYWGYQISDSISAQITETITGSLVTATIGAIILLYVVGIIKKS